MRRRIGIASYTGLGGNNSPVILENTGALTQKIKQMMKDAWSVFPVMKEMGGCDYDISQDSIKFGIEPSYQGDDLEVICLSKEIANCYIDSGHAFGYYGSGIRSKRKYYFDYKKPTRFTKFVDKWHPILFK